MRRTSGYRRAPAPESSANGHRPFEGFLFGQGQIVAAPAPAGLGKRRARRAASTSSAPAVAELLLSVSGVALALFMFMHLGLLFTVVIGAGTMDSLAAFLENNYLLQAFAPLLIAVLLAHVLLTARKAPTTLRQQAALAKQLGRLKHIDTWTWAFQLTSGVALLVFAAIHIWAVLTDLPIDALKSASRVHGTYLGLYAPFVVLAEAHTSLGLYRVAVKWGAVPRGAAHIALLFWGAAVLAIGFTILVTFYRLGG